MVTLYYRSGLLTVLLALFSSIQIFAQVQYIKNENRWVLQTRGMAYNLIVKNNKLYSSYYGPKASHPEQDYPEFIERLEVPVRGGEANKT
ncbi:MAG: hypothetical protein H7096_11430, partial [Flavobacterium sp.]|nr:hypothetical protein [Pedobacter sp.]